jgi:hypothetical protein
MRPQHRRHVVAAFRMQNRNDSSSEFKPGHVVAIDGDAVWVKLVGHVAPDEFKPADFSQKPRVGDRVCYHTYVDFVCRSWGIEVVS